MILSFSSRESFGRQAFLICLPSPVRESTILRRGKVKPETYSGDLLSTLYDAIFRRSLELKRDYTDFYSVEYKSFSEYARKRILIPHDVSLTLEAQLDKSALIFRFRPIYSFLEEEYGKPFLERLLEPRRGEQ
jgi:hypothetical protein